MQKLFFVISLFLVTCSFAQPLRLHILGGMANYSGDIQQKNFTLNQSNPAVAVGGTFNITDKLAVRSDFLFTHLGADDKKSSNPMLIARNLNFKTIVQELSLMGEYDILNINTYRWSPYVFGGIGVFHFSPYTYDAKGQKKYLVALDTEGEGFNGRKDYKTTQLNIPIGGGIKYTLSDDIQIGFELAFRVLKTDYLDDVSKTYIDKNLLLAYRGQEAVDLAFRGDELKNNPQSYPSDGTKRGNPKVNDYYYYAQFRISFRMPWFDNSNGTNGTSGNRQKLNCPTKL